MNGWAETSTEDSIGFAKYLLKEKLTSAAVCVSEERLNCYSSNSNGRNALHFSSLCQKLKNETVYEIITTKSGSLID